MRYVVLLCFGVCFLLVMAQEPVTRGGDTGLEALINKVEGAPKEEGATKVTVSFKQDEDKEWQGEAVNMVKAYYQSMVDDDLIAAYEMMSSDYRKVVKLQSFLKKDRVRLDAVKIDNFEFSGEECARVMGSGKGLAGNRLGNMDLPLKLRIFKEDGKWVVYSNPYKMMGMTLPQSKDIKYPCEN